MIKIPNLYFCIIISESFVQGSLSATYLFEDRTFLRIIERSQEAQCYEGELSSDQYNSFIDYVKSKGLLNIKITQKDDLGLMCESSYQVQITIDNKSNLFDWPCAYEDSESTKKVSSIIGDVFNKLDELKNNSKQVCRVGGFIKTFDIGSCAEYARENHLSEYKYKSYNLSDLDPLLKKSLINEGAYVYIGPIDKIKESYNRMNYAIDGHCYIVSLSEFDGNIFRWYDDILREKNK